MSSKAKDTKQSATDVTMQMHETNALMQSQMINTRPELSALAQDAPNLAQSAYFDERKGHPSREMESRDMASNDHDKLVKYYTDIFKEGAKGKTYFDKEIVPQGYVYGCKAISVLNRPLPSNILEAHRKGWRYVPVDRHPQLITDTSKNFLEVEGLAYMERPKVIHDLEADTYHQEGRKQQQYMGKFVTQDSMVPLQMTPGVNYKPIEGYSYSLQDAETGGFQSPAQAAAYNHGMHQGHPAAYNQGYTPPSNQGYTPPVGPYNHY